MLESLLDRALQVHWRFSFTEFQELAEYSEAQYEAVGEISCARSGRQSIRTLVSRNCPFWSHDWWDPGCNFSNFGSFSVEDPFNAGR